MDFCHAPRKPGDGCASVSKTDAPGAVLIEQRGQLNWIFQQLVRSARNFPVLFGFLNVVLEIVKAVGIE